MNLETILIIAVCLLSLGFLLMTLHASRLSRRYEELLTSEIKVVDPHFLNPIPIEERFTIVDLFFEHRITPEDTLGAWTGKAREQYLKENAGNYFMSEIEKMGGLTSYHEREAYNSNPNYYRFGIKIALSDDR